MENPELILERFDALNDDDLIELVKEALKEAGIPFIEKSNQSRILKENISNWIECGDNQPVSSDKLYCCSACGMGRVFESDRTMFCPYCGADLRVSL